MGSSSVIRWMVFHMMTHAPLTWAYEINCYFNGQVIGSRRQISLARNVEKRHRFWSARALGIWQSIKIACRLQESIREDTGRQVLHVARIELTARSHILVSWSVYPNYEYHYHSMYLVHLWLVEITSRLECISAAAKWSPGRQTRPINGRATQIFPTTGPTGESRIYLAKVHVRIFGYQNIQIWLQYFMSDSPKLLWTTQGTIWVVHWATQDFSLAAALVHAWCDISEWHKFAIAIVTLVFPEPGDCRGTRTYTTPKLHQLTEVSLVQLLRWRI